MTKRKVVDGYEFKTADIFPRWHVRIKEIGGYITGFRNIVRVDHRFLVDDEWNWICCDLEYYGESRVEVSRLIRSAKSEIRAIKDRK